MLSEVGDRPTGPKPVRQSCQLRYNRSYRFGGFAMDIISASQARANLFGLVEAVNNDHLPRIITSKRGDAVLLSKSDWESLQETLYLQSIPGLVESVKEAEMAEDWVSEAEFLRVLDGMDD